MKHYTDKNDKIYAFETDGSQDHLITDDMTPISQEEINERKKPSADQLASRIPSLRYEQEKKGVVYNQIRYSGSESNRQALRGAVQQSDDEGFTEFEIWKDSDGNYHQNHPVTDVKEATRLIGKRRSRLIKLESQYVDQVLSGSVNNLEDLDWTTEFDSNG